MFKVVKLLKVYCCMSLIAATRGEGGLVRKLQEFFKSASNEKQVSKEFQGKFQQYFKGLSGKFQGISKGVAMGIQDSFTNFSPCHPSVALTFGLLVKLSNC